jgi:transglutaminase-like putative cysteine protease
MKAPLFFACTLCWCFCSCREDIAPFITALDPRIGMIGETLTIEGAHFGDEQDESYISIGGAPPTLSSYIEWSDTRIRIRVPEFGESGLVYVHRDGKRSNPLLFSNRAGLPEPVQNRAAFETAGPVIGTIRPASGTIGSLLSIQGSGFGASRQGGKVFFTWAGGKSGEDPASSLIEVAGDEFGYEKWNSRELQVRVPDGAASGNLMVQAGGMDSIPVAFERTGMPGTKAFRDKRTYTITYSVDILVRDAATPNSLYLWVPRPVLSASQRKRELLSCNVAPLAEDYQGTTLFQLHDLNAGANRGVNLSYVVDVYAVETHVRAELVKQTGDSPASALYTSQAIPSDALTALAQTITGTARNPYEKARRIYEWLIAIPSSGDAPGAMARLSDTAQSVLELLDKRAVLDKRTIDAYSASLIFCSLARSARIPAIPVAGVLINNAQATTRHYWAEFWIAGFGWVPVDPALGAGRMPEGFELSRAASQNPGLYYFGNLDNQRIAFSRGERSLSRMDPRGRVAARNQDYALQNLWEEAVGGLESYSSLWSDISVTGMYLQ